MAGFKNDVHEGVFEWLYPPDGKMRQKGICCSAEDWPQVQAELGEDSKQWSTVTLGPKIMALSPPFGDSLAVLPDSCVTQPISTHRDGRVHVSGGDGELFARDPDLDNSHDLGDG